jgi:hypothetical protein
MSFRDENDNSLSFSVINTNTDNTNGLFSVSYSKSRPSNIISIKNSSNKKKGKGSKIFDGGKTNENLNDKNQIKTPQSTSSRIKKGLAVNK